MTRGSTLQHRIAVIVFMALVFTPIAAQIITGGASVSAVERRALAPFPAVADLARDPVSFPEKLSRWMEDHMGLRGPLMNLHAKIQSELDLADTRFAVRGDDGWLFSNINHALQSHRGLYPFAPGGGESWLEGARALKAASCGKPFVILIPPDKHTVYAEHLSKHPRINARATRLETLTALAPEAGLALLSPVDALIAAKQTTQVYYRTDSHWTEPGAYEGYGTLIEGLRAQGLDVYLLPRDRLERSGMRVHEGDLYGLLGVDNAPAEAVPFWRIRSPAQILHEEGIPAYDWQGVKAVRWASSKTAAPRLLVFGDSYFNSMRPYLLESFSSVAYVHHRAGAPPLEVLDACDYDAVVLVMVERMLNHELAPAR